VEQDSNKPSLSYRDAGVDIEAGNSLVERIKPHAARTMRPGVMANLGGFGALFEIPEGYQKPVLVSATDGVGTKLKLAMLLSRHDTIGIDLVAMCVNDLIVQGAEPLFFLDYYATGKLDTDVATDVIKGIADGCELSGSALVGGETAEMPGMYDDEDYDLAGFSVGVVEKSRIIDGSNVKAGDVLIGLASSGPHSNGYSLIRKIIEVQHVDVQQDFNGRPLGEVLLTPTRIYVKPVLKVLEQHRINALAHITGGGLQENIPRVLPHDCIAVIDTNSWEIPPIFRWLQEQGNVASNEMYRTFNCGVGMILAVDKADADAVMKVFAELQEHSWVIGEVASRQGDEAQVKLQE